MERTVESLLVHRYSRSAAAYFSRYAATQLRVNVIKSGQIE